MSLFSTYWTDLLREALPWAGGFFIALSFMGSEYFLVAVIAVGYWVVDKRLSKRAAFLLLIAAISNYWLKILIRNPRPPPSNWLPGVSASNYSLPSGHAQSSTVIWGWVGIRRREALIRIVLIMLILLVGVSRVYLGVHWLGDVVFGWLVGALILGLVQRYEDRVFSVLDSEWFDIGIAAFGFLSMVAREMLSPMEVGDNFGALGGLMIGVGVGFMLEKRYLGFEVIDAPIWRRLLRAGVGLCMVFLVMAGFSGFFPSEIFWLRGIRYALVAVTALFVWPYLFTRLKI